MNDRRSSDEREPPRASMPFNALQPGSVGGLYGVIDLETAPDPHATALMGSKSGSKVNAAAHQIECAAMLVAREHEDGGWGDFNLRTLCSPGTNEPDILRAIDDFLLDIGRGDGTCLTFNGVHHDFGMIRHRAARWWMFECAGIERIRDLSHVDLMRTVTRGWRDEWPSLAAACAGLTIPVNHRLSGAVPRFTDTERKAQVDCICTFLLTLYELSIRRRSIITLARGWTALAAHIEKHWGPEPHLMQFTRHALLEGWNRSAAQRS